MDIPDIAGHADVEFACSRLIIDFANALDLKDYPRALQLFTQDATLERADLSLQGIAQIQAFLEARPAQMLTRHLCSNIRVLQRTADEADGNCYLQFFQATQKGSQASSVKAAAAAVAEYALEFVRHNGDWRIRRLQIRAIFHV